MSSSFGQSDSTDNNRGVRSGWISAWWSSAESLGWILFWGGVCLVIFLGGYWRTQLAMIWSTPWLAVASLLPAVLVLNHGMFVQSLPKSLQIRGSKNQSEESEEEGSNKNISRRLELQIQEEFSRWAITINYYLPTLALAFAGVTLALLVCQLADCCGELGPEIVEGIRFGALGAYAYVLMTLSERTFRRDISPGLAQWSAAQLVLGPIFGGVLAATLLESVQLSQFTRQILYFVAGLAPRQIVAVFSDLAIRFWSNGADVRAPTIIPLSMIGGITTRVQDRLFEEGIEDVHQLAMANPIILVRDTPYELRQIAKWIDKAILYSTLPESAALLQKEGITGAIDLTYYSDRLNKPPAGNVTIAVSPDGGAEASPDSASAGEDRIDQLAKAAHLTRESLAETIQRLTKDHQLQLVWALYQAEPSEDGDSAATESGERR